mgnify:CR=1 FL=1
MKFVIVLVALLLLVALVWGRRARGKGSDTPPHKKAARDAAPEAMLSCAHCGVHLPASEAVLLGKRAYCTAAHRDAGPRAPHG